eukprot:9983-Heterococcus_DN1.PRE.2
MALHSLPAAATGSFQGLQARLITALASKNNDFTLRITAHAVPCSRARHSTSHTSCYIDPVLGTIGSNMHGQVRIAGRCQADAAVVEAACYSTGTTWCFQLAALPSNNHCEYSCAQPATLKRCPLTWVQEAVSSCVYQAVKQTFRTFQKPLDDIEGGTP